MTFCATGCTHDFYQPDSILYYPPAKTGYDARQIEFKSADGTKLLAWFFPAQNTNEPVKGTVVQFHGSRENLSSHYMSLVWLTKRGYNLFAFDYRGYGGSEGKPSQEGTYLDGIAALDRAWELRSGKRFIIYGQSLGGAIAMRALADFSHRNETQLVVLDSTYAWYSAEARRYLAMNWLTRPFSPLAYFFVSDKYAPADALRHTRTRLLVIHDQRDPVVPFANADDIMRLARENHDGPGPVVDLWTLNDGRHIESMAPYNSVYRERFVILLDSL